MNGKFYVYVNTRASDGSVFYVGKGKGDRAWDTYGRSEWWKRIVAKHGFLYKIVSYFSNETCAFSFESALIGHYGRPNLCNLTDGGDGASGYKHTDEAKRKIGDKSRLKVLTDATKEKLRLANFGKKASDETKEKQRQSMHSLMRFADRNPNYKNVRYNFVHRDGSKITCTPLQLAKALGKQTTHIHRLADGKAKSAYGWKLNMAFDPMERE